VVEKLIHNSLLQTEFLNLAVMVAVIMVVVVVVK